MSKSNKFTVRDREITFLHHQEEDFISLTDIAKYRSDYDANDVIRNWMRGKSTLAFLGLWETLNNADFKPVEFDGFKNEAGYFFNPGSLYGGLTRLKNYLPLLVLQKQTSLETLRN